MGRQLHLPEGQGVLTNREAQAKTSLSRQLTAGSCTPYKNPGMKIKDLPAVLSIINKSAMNFSSHPIRLQMWADAAKHSVEGGSTTLQRTDESVINTVPMHERAEVFSTISPQVSIYHSVE